MAFLFSASIAQQVKIPNTEAGKMLQAFLKAIEDNDPETFMKENYDEFTRKNLFEPAGMFHTGYVVPKWNEENFAHGYAGEELFGVPRYKKWDVDGPFWHLRGNGGTLSTAEDMYKWHLALKGNNILSEEAKKKMYTPHIDEGYGDSFYGYGWVNMKTPWGTTLITHNGGNGYFANDFYRYLEDDVVMFITSNNGEMPAIQYSKDILDIVFEAKRNEPQLR
jgi:CubicO group peptidase (beta-lactamase class C family)